jgi:hypothetical protein
MAEASRRPFVIQVGHFNDEMGGVIALHRLCHLLNEGGYEAYVWPPKKPRHDPAHPVRSTLQRLSYWLRGKDRRLRRAPGFITPIARERHVAEGIVVYPEIVDGNPLRAERVVRWLLHKPGFHTGRAVYGPHDKFFFFQNAFNDPAINPHPDNLLKTVFIRDDIYKQTNFGPRSGTCYILRKGKDRPIVHPLENSVLVDDLSHRELAEVFNRVETCISYDTYTLYSAFAALCGCVSVVVPEEGKTKEEWYPDERDRYGQAWGFEDVEWARRTAPLLLPHLKAQEREANDSVRVFAEKCQGYFP